LDDKIEGNDIVGACSRHKYACLTGFGGKTEEIPATPTPRWDNNIKGDLT
jgi:hypothetical protein